MEWGSADELMSQERSPIAECRVGGLQQVSLRVDANELGHLQQAVEESCDLGAALGARALVIVAAEDGASQSTLRCVVVERQER